MAIEIYNPVVPVTTKANPNVLVLNDDTGLPTYADATLLQNVVVVDYYDNYVGGTGLMFEGSLIETDTTRLYYVKNDNVYLADGNPRLFRIVPVNKWNVLADGITPDTIIDMVYSAIPAEEAYISDYKEDGFGTQSYTIPYVIHQGYPKSVLIDTINQIGSEYASVSRYAYNDASGNNISDTYATKTENDLKQIVFTGICQQQYLTENDIYINATDSTVVVGGISVPAKNLAILTVRGGTAISASNPICFYTDGSGVATKHIKTEPQFVPFADLQTPTDNTGVWYFYFDSNGVLRASKTAWTSFDNIAAVYRLYWNNGLSGAARNVIEAIECHKNDISWADHAWKHNEGTKWISGFNITYGTTTGTPAADGSNTCVALSTGKNVDDNLFYEVKNVASPTNKFEQDLGSAASITAGGQFICTYNDGSGLLNKIAATRFPFLFNGSNTPEYVTQNGTRTSVTANYFFVYYIYALQDPRVGEAVKIRSAEVEFASASAASAHSWEQLQSKFPTLQDNEIRVLYKLTYEYKSSYDVAVKKAALREVVDLRRQKISSLIASGGSTLASSVVVTPSGGITSTNAQGAFNEVGSHMINSNPLYQHLNLDNTVTDAGVFEYKNLLPQSESFNTTWSKSYITVTSDSIKNPLSVGISADLMTVSGSYFDGFIRVGNGAIAINSTYTFSIYVKPKANVTWFRMRNLSVNDNSNGEAWFNLATGVVGQVNSAITGTSIVALSDGWFRCSITGNTIGVVSNPTVDFSCATNNGWRDVALGQEYYAYGAQLELGSVATNYQATTTIGSYSEFLALKANKTDRYTGAQVNNFTVALGTPVANQINTYTMTLVTGTSVPTVTWPSGVIWTSNGIPALLPNSKYIVVFTYLENGTVFGNLYDDNYGMLETAAVQGASSYTLIRNKEVNLTGTMLNGVTSTIILPTPVSGKKNESVLHFRSNATAAPTIAYSGFTPLWLGGKTLAMTTSKNYTICFEQIYTGSAWIVKTSWGEY